MTVVLIDARRPSLIPVEAVRLLVGDVQYTEDVPLRLPWSLPAARPVADTTRMAPVLVSANPHHPAVRARIAAGETVIAAPDALPGERLLDAVALMDQLRVSGPWERMQTHESLQRYLLEETYEVFDAIRGGDPGELREELGDILLQVLFHARVAADDGPGGFDIDDVATALVRKLLHRVPAVLAGRTVSLDEQLAQWEQRKAEENTRRGRTSVMDDIPTAQPALALTQKVFGRATTAGVPMDLIPGGMAALATGFADAETELRTAALAFMDALRAAERAVQDARAASGDTGGGRHQAGPGPITAQEWREHWPAQPGWGTQPSSVEPQ